MAFKRVSILFECVKLFMSKFSEEQMFPEILMFYHLHRVGIILACYNDRFYKVGFYSVSYNNNNNSNNNNK